MFPTLKGLPRDVADYYKVDWKAPDTDGLVEFLCRDKGFK